MKKEKPKCFWVPNHFEPGHHVFVVFGPSKYLGQQLSRRFGTTAEDVHQLTHAEGNEEELAGVCSELKAEDSPSMFALIWVSDCYGVWSLNWMSVIDHEVSHLVDRIFDNWNIPPGRESTELRACLHESYSKLIKGTYRGLKPRSPREIYEIPAKGRKKKKARPT